MRLRFRRGAVRIGLLGLLVGSVMLTLLVGSSAAAPTCTTSAGVTTCEFAYTGAVDTWTVPAGVTSATFDLYGAAGGKGIDPSPLPGGLGGKGGHVQATLAVTPGATFNLRVGGKGEDAPLVLGPGPVTVAGGFNGGGTNTLTACGFCDLGGGGGGASDVRLGGDSLANRLLVAGAGGGGGLGGASCDPPGPQGGPGGNSEATAPTVSGNEGCGIPRTCSGGGAGTQSGPGAAGTGTGCTSGSPGDAAGGAGGGSIDVLGVGAGGGGYFGGGAGAGSSLTFSGGGGGSNFVDPSATGTTVENGVRAGNGLITITYAEPPPTYEILGFFSPAPKSKWKVGSTVPIKIALALNGTRISDTEAAGLLSPTCRVFFSAGATPSVGPVCMTYNASANEFRFNWKIAKGTTAPATIPITVTVKNANATTNATLSEQIMLTK